MTPEEKIEKGLGELTSLINKNNEEVKAHGKAHEETKEAIKKVEEKLLKSEKDAEEKQKQLDAMDIKLKEAIARGTKNEVKSTFESLIGEHINSEAFKEFKANKRKGISFDLNIKAGDMTSANTYTGAVVEPDRVRTDIIFNPFRPVRMRQLIPLGNTGSNSITYVQESAYDDGTSTVSEGATKPQSDFDVEVATANVRKIAAYMRLTEEMLEDTVGLQSYLTARLMGKVLDKEDQQILFGTGTGSQITGLTVNAAAYSDILADAKVNRYDVLAAALNQLTEGNFVGSGIVLHSRDRLKLLLTKDDDGMYVYPMQVRTGGNITVDGTSVFVNNALTQGKFLVADFSRCQLFDRTSMNVRFYEQDQDNAIKNLITVVAEERIALTQYNPTAFVYGDFATALAEGTL